MNDCCSPSCCLSSQGQRLEFHQHQRVCVRNGFTCWVCVCVCVCVCCLCVSLTCVKVIMTADSDCVDFFRPFQVRRGQRTVQTETKYIELMVVNDHELVGVHLTAPSCLLFPYLCSCCAKAIISSWNRVLIRCALLIRLYNQHGK